MRSRVMPGSLVTIERRVPVRRLNRVDLPTLGRPTITRLGSFSMFGVDTTLARLQVGALGAAESRASTLDDGGINYGNVVKVPMRRIYLFYMLGMGSQTSGGGLLSAQETDFLDRALTRRWRGPQTRRVCA